jgi:hypothetical protein
MDVVSMKEIFTEELEVFCSPGSNVLQKSPNWKESAQCERKTPVHEKYKCESVMHCTVQFTK